VEILIIDFDELSPKEIEDIIKSAIYKDLKAQPQLMRIESRDASEFAMTIN